MGAKIGNTNCPRFCPILTCGWNVPIAKLCDSCKVNRRKQVVARENTHRVKPKVRFHYSIREAKERKLDWTITFEEYCSLIEEPCLYCMDAFCIKTTKSVGLDRLDSSKGYHADKIGRAHV